MKRLGVFAALLALAFSACAQPRIVQSVQIGNNLTSTGAATARSFYQPSTVMVSGDTSSGTGSATVYVQVSNDGTNFVTACTITLALTTSVSSDGCAINAMWQHVRVNVNAISGTGASLDAWLGA